MPTKDSKIFDEGVMVLSCNMSKTGNQEQGGKWGGKEERTRNEVQYQFTAHDTQ